jgi:hypothetical protein
MMSRLNGIIPPSLPPLPSLHSGGNYNNASTYNTFAPVQNNSTESFPMPEIRTEADLHMFNQFMVSLGRSAVGIDIPQNGLNMQHTPSFGSSLSNSNSSVTGSPLSDQSPIEDLFNPQELASLGLDLPGLSSVPQLPPPANTVNFGSMYPSLDNRVRSQSDMGDFKRTIAALPPRNHSVSAMPNFADFGGMGNNMDFGFDFYAQAKPNVGGSMRPTDFNKKTYHHVPALGAAVSSRMRESRMRTEVEDDSAPPSDDEMSTPRGSPAPISRPRISVRQLLTADDLSDGDDLKLPAIKAEHGTPPEEIHLPSLHELARPPTKRQVEDDIVRGVKRLELEAGERARPPTADGLAPTAFTATRRVVDPERMQHAAMIKAWLIHVNLEFRKRRLLDVSDDEDELDEDE